MRACVVCGASLEGLGNRAIRCKKCQREHRLHYWRKRMQVKRSYMTHSTMVKLGTTDFGSHRNKDFNVEHTLIQKELKRLGLRK